MVAEITVVTTSWRLLNTCIFGVQGGAWVPLGLPRRPLTVEEQRPPLDCSRMLQRMIDRAVVPPLVAWFSCTKLSYCALKKQKSWTHVCPHMLISLWVCLPSMVFWSFEIKFGTRCQNSNRISVFSLYSEHKAPAIWTLQSTCQRALEQDA